VSTFFIVFILIVLILSVFAIFHLVEYSDCYETAVFISDPKITWVNYIILPPLVVEVAYFANEPDFLQLL